MHGSLDKSGKSDKGFSERWRIGFLPFPCFCGGADRVGGFGAGRVHMDIGRRAGGVCRHLRDAGARSDATRTTEHGNSDRQSLLTQAGAETFKFKRFGLSEIRAFKIALAGLRGKTAGSPSQTSAHAPAHRPGRHAEAQTSHSARPAIP